MTRLTVEPVAAEDGTPLVLRVAGCLDDASAPVLHEALARCLSTEPDVVVLDLVTVTETSGDAVAGFRGLADRARAWPGAIVVLSAPPPEVAAGLAAAGVAEHVPVYPSVQAALAGAADLRGREEPHRLRLRLSPVNTAGAATRRLVDKACAMWNLPALRDSARLVATELVSNAVRHAATALEVTLSRRADAVYVSVRDHSPVHPVQGGPVPAHIEGGRGLIVVGLMSRAWGTTPTTDGKVVWATLTTG